MAAYFENCDHMIGVLFRFQIEDQWWKSENAKCRRAKNSALQTRRDAIVQDFLWRSRGVAKAVRQVVEKPLNARRRLERTQAPQFGRREAESVCAVHERSSPLSNACYVLRKLSEAVRASRSFLRGVSVTKLRVTLIIRQRKGCEDSSHPKALRAQCHTGYTHSF